MAVVIAVAAMAPGRNARGQDSHTDSAVAAGQPLARDAREMDLAGRLYRAALSAAEKSIRLNDVAESHEWLAQAPPSQRGWEWRFLAALAGQLHDRWLDRYL